MKNSSDTIGNRNRDLPTCSLVPQPTALPRTPGNRSTWRKMCPSATSSQISRELIQDRTRSFALRVQQHSTNAPRSYYQFYIILGTVSVVKQCTSLCVISGFLREVAENCALRCCYVASSGNVNVYGSVHRKNVPIYIQQYATLHTFIISGNCCICFGWYLHPSSGAHTTVSTASGICHTVTATCRYRGSVGTLPR